MLSAKEYADNLRQVFSTVDGYTNHSEEVVNALLSRGDPDEVMKHAVSNSHPDTRIRVVCRHARRRLEKIEQRKAVESNPLFARF